jgi:hypothetical protein
MSNVENWNALPLPVQTIFRRYRIISVQDEEVSGRARLVEGYTMVNIRKSRNAEGQTLGDGLLLSLDCIKRFLEADSTNDYKWLDWMLFHACGGEEAKRRSAQAMDQVKERFIDERVRGYRDARGRYNPPITKEEAQNRWDNADPRFKEVLNVGDQDMVDKLQVFGFYRNWPGMNKVYEKVTSAVRLFLANSDRVQEMNAFMIKQGMSNKLIALKPESYTTVDSLETANKRVKRFFDSREARADIRVESIFEDDIVKVICPLTFAAAVKYGWDAWPFANRTNFESCLEGSVTQWQDQWKSMVKSGKVKEAEDGKILVYFQFKIPMPCWISYTNNRFQRCTLNNLAAMAPKKKLKSLGDVDLLDEENRVRSYEDVSRQIEAEAHRVYSPDEEEYPIHRGPRVFEGEREASKVIRHLDRAFKAMLEWAKDFDPARVIADYLPDDSR